MVSTQGLYLGVLGLVGAERLVELWLSKRNAERAFARGAIEVGQGHYWVMTVFHGAFLAACVAEPLGLGRPWPGALGWAALGAAAAAQGLRWWAIATLGERWNTRIVVLPGAEPVVGGPYRYVRHPNYVAVVVELLALPLIHGAYLTAAAFSAGNAALLWVRIRAEEGALGERWEQAFAGRPRFVPAGAAEGPPREVNGG